MTKFWNDTKAFGKHFWPRLCRRQRRRPKPYEISKLPWTLGGYKTVALHIDAATRRSGYGGLR
ncbi:hypothetical protein LCGC14_1346820 [marine sediment metagenome]|uniref:Uncharacterized protein n=1 Tax=marine sediment metagenome TaxID=412755 RepID=A0A0F9KCP0_9ZZZZ